MPQMQLSLFAETDLALAAGPATPRRSRRTTTPTSALAVRVAQVHAAQAPDEHAAAVDALLTAATPRVAQITQLFLPSWPEAHVELDDLVQEALLEVAASVDQAPCTSVGQTMAWLTDLVTRALHERWHLAMVDAVDHRAATEEYAARLEMAPDDANTGHLDDEAVDVDDPYDVRAA